MNTKLYYTLITLNLIAITYCMIGLAYGDPIDMTKRNLIPAYKNLPEYCSDPSTQPEFQTYVYNNITIKTALNYQIDWKGLIDQINPTHLKGLKEIQFFPSKQFTLPITNQTYCKTKGLKGRYYTQTIQITNSSEIFFNYLSDVIDTYGRTDEIFGTNPTLTTLRHETGHHIYYTLLNQTTRNKWCQTAKNQTYFLTIYSKRDCSENFAEEYAIYQHNPKNLPLEKRKLMKEMLT